MSANTTTALAIADPYAQALMGLAKDQDLVDRFGEDAQAVLDFLGESEELRQFLANPVLPADAKKNVLQQMAGDSLHPTFINFMKLLVDKGRILFLEAVLKQYQDLFRQLKGTVLAEIESAVELSDEQQGRIREKVTALTGAAQVDLAVTVDPDLLGGVIIKVRSQIFDASLRGQLRRLSLQLSASA